MRWLRAASVQFRNANIDQSTEHGRGRERFRRIGLTTVAALAARGIAFITGFVTVPLTVHYLGTERYGMWATLSSVIALATFADFGLGNGLLNALSAAHGRDDRELARRQVSSAFFMLLGVAVVLGTFFALAHGHIAWPRLYNVSSLQARREAVGATTAFVACFLVGLPVGIIPRIRQGYQEGYWNSAYDAAGAVLGLIGVLVAIQFHASLPWLVLAMAGAPVAATLVHAIVLLGRDRSWLRIRPSNVDAQIAKRLLQHGALFFALQLAAALAYAPDNVIIAQTLGAASVTPYSVAAKLFSISLLLSDVALSPLWPAYGEAMARGDTDWVRRTLVRSLQIAAMASVALSAMLVLTGNVILTIWVGSDMQASTTLLLGLGLWTVLAALGTSVAMYLNASNLMWIQLGCSLLTVPTSILLKIAFVRRWGISAVPWAMVIAYVLLTVVPLVVFSRRAAARGQRLLGNT